MTTLAELTTEETNKSVGMWCQAHNPSTGKPIVRGVLASIDDNTAELIIPDDLYGTLNRQMFYAQEQVSLLPDLLRAWQPDGTPANMRSEDSFWRKAWTPCGDPIEVATNQHCGIQEN